ncbi:calcium/sodium antiporter [Halobellus captivus]|uniref:calcium/sodium antiporter n=1 Tax=Halobellus captivus TaxID=2592614 RepID=UPI0011A2E3DD|nr:calcium/sodium antiporter [Halobellus captivus]
MISGIPAAQACVILLTVLGLWIGARLLTDAGIRLARHFGLSELTVGLTVVALGTSMPELAVSVDAALKGTGDIAVGNVLGSNIYNVAFILGALAMVEVLSVTDSLVRRDGAALLVSTLLGAVLISDLRVTRLEGAVLALAFVAYTSYLLRTARDGSAAENRPREPGEAIPLATDRASVRGRDAITFVVGLAIVLVSGDFLVLSASELARSAGISEWIIGGTIVAAGTSTPEFAVSIVAVTRGSVGVSVGNVLGSNVLNVTGILGAAALVRPLETSPAALETLAWLVAITVVLVAALWTGRALSRLEGGLLAGSEVVRWVLGLLGAIG